MRLRTETDIQHPGPAIECGDSLFSIGSCFAENIASRLDDGGFRITSNPFGVLYNPESIALAIGHIHCGHEFTPGDTVKNNGLWCSPHFHGSFSGTKQQKVIENMNTATHRAAKALREARFVFISFGTPWVYKTSAKFTAAHPAVPTGMTVANCHKLPAGYFDRTRLTISEITALYNELLKGPLKNKEVIFTVSPVRYIKDGLHGSNLGKAILQLAVEQLCNENDNCTYFPAYEALVDDLRDYRFYADDLVHPSRQAIEYIWELFRTTMLTPAARGQATQINKVTGAMQHRVQNPGSDEHRRWLEKMLSTIYDLQREYPQANLTKQTAYFTGLLTKTAE